MSQIFKNIKFKTVVLLGGISAMFGMFISFLGPTVKTDLTQTKEPVTSLQQEKQVQTQNKDTLIFDQLTQKINTTNRVFHNLGC